MSKSEEKNPKARGPARKAVALQYGSGDMAPVVVASGMGYMAEKIVEVASDSGVPVYEDDSLATVLTQLRLGQEIPEELYQAIVEIYLYFLKFDPNHPDGPPKKEQEQKPEEKQEPEQEPKVSNSEEAAQ